MREEIQVRAAQGLISISEVGLTPFRIGKSHEKHVLAVTSPLLNPKLAPKLCKLALYKSFQEQEQEQEQRKQQNE